jgi:hypothetical protein
LRAGQTGRETLVPWLQLKQCDQAGWDGMGTIMPNPIGYWH